MLSTDYLFHSEVNSLRTFFEILEENAVKLNVEPLALALVFVTMVAIKRNRELLDGRLHFSSISLLTAMRKSVDYLVYSNS